MIRARPGTPTSVRRHPLPIRSALAAAGILAVLFAGCGLPGESSAPPATSSATVAPPSSSPSPSSPAPTPSPEPSPTDEPTPSEEPTATPEPTPSEAASPTPSGSASAGTTAACFGSSDTKDFFSAFAHSVPWPVYCAVLPRGWSVEKGSYRLRDGGHLTISYRRRADGARLVLSEGSLCRDSTPCVPSGSGAGTTPFADREADLLATTDPVGFAAVVDADEEPAWLLTGTAIDEAEFRTIAAALHLIDE